MPAVKKVKSIYSVHPSVEMVQSVTAGMAEKTGHSLEEWIALVKKSGPKDDKERRDWLKTKHKLGTNYANWIVERAAGRGEEDGDPEKYLVAAEEWVETMFSGPKAKLRPLYDDLLELGLGLGDVRACPCKTIVPLYRNHVFAQLKPATTTRIDVGFALKDLQAEGRLIDTGGFAKGDRITHRIPVSSPADIDAELKSWLKRAYELDVPAPKKAAKR